MDFLDNEYKNRFQNKHLSDDKIDADDLWAAIEENLASSNHKPNGFLHWANKHRFSIFTTISFVLLFGYGLINSNKQNNNNNFTTQNTPKVSSNNNNFTTQNTPSVGSNNNIFTTQNTPKVGSNNNNFTTQSTPKVGSTIGLNASVFHDDSKNTLQNEKIFEIAKIDSQFQKALTVASISAASKNEITNSDKTAISQNQGILNVTNIDLLPLLNPKISVPTQSIYLLQKANLAAPIRPLKTKMRGEVGLSFGINTLKMNYLNSSDATIMSLKNETEKLEMGWNSGVYFTAIFGKKWRLSSGLNYQQYISKFDYKNEKTTQILKENQLLQVWINERTGETLQRRYGDTLVNALSVREVVHYNSFKQLQLPLLLGFEKDFNKWRYGIDAGATLHFTLSQSGRLLDELGEIQFFGQGDGIAPLRNFSVGIQINPFVSYKINTNYSITLQPQWAFQQNTTIGTTGMKLQAHQFGLNIISIVKF